MENLFEQIDSLTVTHRSYEAILDICQLTKDDIEQLPRNATVVDVGSGEFQEFSQGIKKQRPDVFVVSIDPSMALEGKDKNVIISESGSGKTYYRNPSQNKGLHKEHPLYTRIQLSRVRNAKHGTVATIVPPIPLKPQSVDLLVDSYGPSLYLEEEAAIVEYIKEISRVLKSGGYAKIFPVGILTPLFFKDQQEETKITETVFQKISQGVKDIADIKLFFDLEGAGVQIRKSKELR